jgi:hypothetical protein
MSSVKNCSSCLQQVGKMEDGTWIFYKELGINHIISEKKISALVEYGCKDCINSKYHKWICVSCNRNYNKEDEFCDSVGYHCCIQCLKEKVMLTKHKLNCSCMVCVTIEHNL